jgi:hypothetical protein
MSQLILKKRIGFILTFALLIPAVLFAFYQTEVNSFNQKLGTQLADIDSLQHLYGHKKVLLKGYERQALLALVHYPELKEVFIEFKMVEAESPFVSRPTVLSTLFRSASKRHYLVLISTKSNGWLGDILIDDLPFEAQIGVLGHELAHTVNFVDRSFFKMLRVPIGNLSTAYLNKFEYATDQRAIDHGLGCNLLQWSTFVSSKIPKDYLNGPERYMRPETIINILNERNEICK